MQENQKTTEKETETVLQEQADDTQDKVETKEVDTVQGEIQSEQPITQEQGEEIQTVAVIEDDKGKRKRRAVSATKVLVGTAVFAALAYAISFLEFPIFPASPFLKLDFSLVIILLCGFIYGPIAGISASAVKEGICALTKSSTGGVGELANFGTTIAFIIIPTVVYFYKKGFLTVALTLIAGCILQCAVAMLMNRYVNFPLFMGEGAKEVFDSLWYYVLGFNAIKTVVVSVMTVLLYKHISRFIKFVNSKF